MTAVRKQANGFISSLVSIIRAIHRVYGVTMETPLLHKRAEIVSFSGLYKTICKELRSNMKVMLFHFGMHSKFYTSLNGDVGLIRRAAAKN